ncbi:MAG: single-stranded-DNA-specific exonuclease RecJ [Spongiibacteraceae bacterium]|jgi:single-stranded-DNA-specific exonuclease|nr:single-stranded-DNA-specific exonuclease RecJ [Spongiibacteraceae bacterium]
MRKIRRREVVCHPTTATGAWADLHPLLVSLYRARGIEDERQLSRDLKVLAPPTALKGLPVAGALVADAVERGERVLILGDFDADGATSCALAVLGLRAMGAAHVDFLVPNRFEYGYGLTPEIVAVAAQMRPDLIITVDNGISSLEGVAAANALGIRVLITDHHLPGAELPDAACIVNPNQPECGFPSKHLAGVGVIFYVMTAVRAELRRRDWFRQRGLAEPNMADYLDLVALGTVADVVPLDHNNRVLVAQGLRRIRAGRCRPGISALLAVARRDPGALVASDLGFAVGPRLNAAGRLDDMSLGIKCLLTDDPVRAEAMAQQLDELNRDRRAIESSMQREALASLDALQLDAQSLPWGLCLYQPEWHQGVIGILASRIKDRFHRPTIVFADSEEEGMVKGSARSITGLHIRDALDAVAATHRGLLSKFGGHAMAAGMTLRRERVDHFRDAFDAVVRMQLTEADLTAVLWSDGELAFDDLNLELAQAIQDGGPWGQHFPEPLFDGEFTLVQQRLVGEKHLKLVLGDPRDRARLVDGIAFNVDLRRWPDASVQRVRAAYRLDINRWRGQESVQLIVEHLEPL